MPDYQLLVIDFNHLCHRTFHSNYEMCTTDGVKTGVVFGVLRTLRMLSDTYKPDQVVFCKDIGQSFRRQIVESYKGSRGPKTDKEESDRTELYNQMDTAESMLNCLGVPVIHLHGLEADDLCAVVVHMNPDKEILLMSGDKDFLQLIRPKVSWLNPNYDKIVSLDGWKAEDGLDHETFIHNYHKNKIVHPKTFTRKSEKLDNGIELDQWLLYRSLVGDSSDELTGIVGIGEKTAAKIVSQCSTIDEVLSNKDSLKLSDRVKNNLTETDLKLQYNLIDLNLVVRSSIFPRIVEDVEKHLNVSNLLDHELFQRMALNLQFTSILADFHQFIKNVPTS